jgi:hypothetical protein
MTNRASSPDSESDYEVVGVGRGHSAGGIVSVRLKPDEMELLTALSEVTGRSLSETLRAGLRCLGRQPSPAVGSGGSALRLETRGTPAVTEFSSGRSDWSQPGAAATIWAT